MTPRLLLGRYLVAGIPASLADILCRILPWRRLRSPWPFPAYPMALTWHACYDADPGSRCFRSVIIGALKGSGRRGAG